MGLFHYLLFFLLPFSFGYPNKNANQKSEGYLVPSEFHQVPSVPSSKPVFDLGCSQNEHFSSCSAHCQHNCSDWGLPIPCPDGCFSGCVCDDGYVRGPKDDCVLVKECSASENKEEIDYEDLLKRISLFDCPEKESYSLCNAHCQSNCSTIKNPAPCSDECISGCVCNAGYLRDLDGKCIPMERCLFLEEKAPEEEDDFCPPNEVFSPCLAHCQKNCTNWSDLTAPCLKICVQGCICDNGMVRGPYGNCIWPRKCPTSHVLQSVSEDVVLDCPVNEHFERCKAHCQKNCSNWDQEIKCQRICVSGCVCDKDFVRGPSGKCVLVEKCSSLDQKPKKNIKKKSFNSCPDGEEKSSLQPKADSNVFCTSGSGLIEFCPPTYLKGCVCKRGQVRGDDSHCIDRRLLPNANEIHFMREDGIRNTLPPERNSNLEVIEDSSAFSESSENSTLDSTTSPPVISDEKINTESNANDEISTIITQESSVGNSIDPDPESHGCPDSQKCFEWCQEEGFPKGICFGRGALKRSCVCFR